MYFTTESMFYKIFYFEKFTGDVHLYLVHLLLTESRFYKIFYFEKFKSKVQCFLRHIICVVAAATSAKHLPHLSVANSLYGTQANGLN